MKADKIVFNIEGSDKECAFFALYAGLRMYYEQRTLRDKCPDEFSISAAECYGLLNQLEENFPKEFADSKVEFNEVYDQLMKPK